MTELFYKNSKNIIQFIDIGTKKETLTLDSYVCILYLLNMILLSITLQNSNSFA